jgi:hypothetical protein
MQWKPFSHLESEADPTEWALFLRHVAWLSMTDEVVDNWKDPAVAVAVAVVDAVNHQHCREQEMWNRPLASEDCFCWTWRWREGGKIRDTRIRIAEQLFCNQE